jgi:predicted nucleic acid-binding protein
MACLDTTLLLDLRGRGGRKLQDRARRKVLGLSLAGEELTTTIFNLAELWVGIEQAADREEEQAIVEQILSPLRVLDFDPTSARGFGRITAHLQRLGRPAGDMDVLIAAVAMIQNQKVVTRNSEHFARIPGLQVESY